MAFSTFVFDTLDVCTRLARYIIQELVNRRGFVSGVLATLATVALPAYFIIGAEEGSWIKFWTVFGSSNQLLAALTLLSITVWLYRARRRIAFTLFPMLFVLTLTLWSLGKVAIGNIAIAEGVDIATVNAIAAIALILLAVYLTIAGITRWLRADRLPVGFEGEMDVVEVGGE
jgi:carbon starvation protein